LIYLNENTTIRILNYHSNLLIKYYNYITTYYITRNFTIAFRASQFDKYVLG